MSLLQTMRVAKLKAETELRIAGMTAASGSLTEHAKAESKLLDAAVQDARTLDQEISEGWKHLQIIKDELAKLAARDRYFVDMAYDRLLVSSVYIADAYARVGSRLPAETREAWHRVKNLAAEIEARCKGWVASGTTHDLLTNDDRAELHHIRLALSEGQHVLSEQRQSLLSHTVGTLAALVPVRAVQK